MEHDPLIRVDAVNEMWMGNRIAECMGFNHPDHEWDDNSILDYLEKLVEVHDAFVYDNGFVSSGVDSIKPLQNKDFPNPLSWWKAIRDGVVAYSQQNPDIQTTVILNKMGITLPEFLAAVTVNKAHYDLTEEQLNLLCSEMSLPNAKMVPVGRKFGVSRQTMKYFKRLGTAVCSARTIEGHRDDTLEES